MHTPKNFAIGQITNAGDFANSISPLTIPIGNSASFGSTFPMYAVVGSQAANGGIDSAQPYDACEITAESSGQLTFLRDAPVSISGTPLVIAGTDARLFIEMQAAILAVLPWRVSIDVFEAPDAHSGFTGIDPTQTNVIYKAYRYTSGVDGTEYIEWYVLLSAGTWTVGFVDTTGSNQGIMTVSLDGVSVGTHDQYSSGGTVFNVVSEPITGVTVAANGLHLLKLAFATKNSSASAFVGCIQHVWMRRTA